MRVVDDSFGAIGVLVVGEGAAWTSIEHALDDQRVPMVSVRSLDEAMSRYGTSRISLVVVDGDASTDALGIIKRAEEALPHSGVVVISSTPVFGDIVRTYAVGAHLHVSRDVVGDIMGPWYERWTTQRHSATDLLRGDVWAAIRPVSGAAATHAAHSIVTSLQHEAVQPEFDITTVITDAVEGLPTTRDSVELTDHALQVMESRAFDRFETGRLADVATDTEGPGGASLHWNSRFPGNEAVLARWPEQPGSILSDTDYRFETALETTPGSGVTQPIRNPERLVGTEVVFQLKGTGITFTIDDEPNVAHQVIQSRPLPVTATGTPAFKVSCRAGRGGRAVIEADLLVRGARTATQRIELRLAGDADAARPAAMPSAGSHRPGALDAEAIATTIAVDVGLTVDGTPDAILLDAHGTEGEFRVWDKPVEKSRAAMAALVASTRPALVQLSKRYADHSSGDGFTIGALAGDTLLGFAQIGWDLHQALFGLPDSGTDVAAIGRAIASTARSGADAVLEIEDRVGVPIPWGIVYDAGAYASALDADGSPDAERYGYPRTPADVDIASFWGHRFAVYRTIPQRPDVPSPAMGGPDDGIAVTAVLNPALGADVVDRQQALFTADDADGGNLFATDSLLRDRESFLRWVHDGQDSACDLLYFFCHAMSPSEFGASGHPTGAASEWEAALGLGGETEAGASATIHELQIEWGKQRQRRPVVMLNACGSTQTDAIYGAPFVSYFLGAWLGRALVGTDWTVPTLFADAFSRAVMAELRTGTPLLLAIRAASRMAFDQGNPYPLIYSLYGQPNVRFAQRSTHE